MENLNEPTKIFTPAQEKKIMVCETVEAILAVAKAEGLEITMEQAEEIINMKENGLSDDELGKVNGGAGYT